MSESWEFGTSLEDQQRSDVAFNLGPFDVSSTAGQGEVQVTAAQPAHQSGA